MVLGQSADPELHLVHVAVGSLQGRRGLGIGGDLREAGIGRQTQRHPGFVQGAESEITSALQVDGGQVHTHPRYEQEVAEVVDNVNVEGVRQVIGQVAQQAVGTTVDDEISRVLEERILERDRRADHIALLVGLFQIGRDDRVTEPERRTGEFFGEAGINVGLVAPIPRDRVGTEQVRQELGVGDVGDLRGDDRASLLVELVAGPVGMRHRQLVDLAVVLAQEDGLQGGEVGIFPNPDISGHVGTIDDRQVIAL